MNWTLIATLLQIVIYGFAVYFQQKRITTLEANALTQSQTIKDIASSISAQKQLTDSMNSFLERVQAGRMDDIAQANQHVEWNKAQQEAKLEEFREKHQAQLAALEKSDASEDTSAILKAVSEQLLGLEEKILARDQVPAPILIRREKRENALEHYWVMVSVQNTISVNLDLQGYKVRGGTLDQALQWVETWMSRLDNRIDFEFLIIYFGEATFREGVFAAVRFYFDNEYVPHRGQLRGNSPVVF